MLTKTNITKRKGKKKIKLKHEKNEFTHQDVIFIDVTMTQPNYNPSSQTGKKTPQVLARLGRYW